MARVLVLGAGFGGIATATRLRPLLYPAHEVVLVDRRVDFVMGLRKTWAVLGSHPIEDGRRSLAALRPHGIDVRTATVEAIDPATAGRSRRRVADADAIVVAWGREPGASRLMITASRRVANAERARTHYRA
jgi:sulfide:quinone oxidoreductase